MKNPVAERKAPLAKMRIQHETPLVIWSNRKGPVGHLGSISPSFLPLHVLETAGMSHPYYTGFLGEMRQRYRVVDRNVLVTPRGMATFDWGRAKEIDPAIRDFRLLQFDIMFGKRHGEKAFFPSPKKDKRSTS